MQKRVFILSLLAFALLALPATAQLNPSPLLEPFSKISIAEIYLANAAIIDFFLVFIIFAGVAKFALGDKYGDSSKMVAVVVGIVLAFGFVVFEGLYGFNLGSIGWVSWIVFFGVLVFTLYSLMVGLGAGPKIAIAVMYIISYAMVGAFFPEFYSWMNANAENNYGMALLILLIHIMLIWSVIRLILSIVSGLKSKTP